jgi:hypothetical protein
LSILRNDHSLRPQKMRLRYQYPSPMKVMPASSIALKKAVELIAHHFKNEMDFDSVQFKANETLESSALNPWEAYLFHERGDTSEHDIGKNKVQFFGACCFSNQQQQNSAAPWSLDWVWFHPYFRNRHHLRNAWPQFVQSYGDFRLEEPLSPAMSVFLKKLTVRSKDY